MSLRSRRWPQLDDKPIDLPTGTDKLWPSPMPPLPASPASGDVSNPSGVAFQMRCAVWDPCPRLFDFMNTATRAVSLCYLHPPDM